MNSLREASAVYSRDYRQEPRREGEGGVSGGEQSVEVCVAGKLNQTTRTALFGSVSRTNG